MLAVVALVVSEGCGGQETEKRIDLGVEAGSAAETEEVEAVAEAAPGDAQGEAEGVPEQLGPTEDAAAEAEPEP